MSISIHAPREGGDSRMYTLSAASKISIHAPREGGDPEYGYVLGGCHGISIHAPREGGDSPVFGMTTYSI